MRMFKKLVIFLVLLTATPAHAVETPAAFVVHGSGYGHGVGMSQMGARSMALGGQTAEQILEYFYKDVDVESLDDTKIVRVNIGHLLTSTKISTITDGAVVQLFTGDIGDQVDAVPIAVLTGKLSLNFSVLGANVVPSATVAKKISIFSKSRSFTIRWSGTRYLDLSLIHI